MPAPSFFDTRVVRVSPEVAHGFHRFILEDSASDGLWAGEAETPRTSFVPTSTALPLTRFRSIPEYEYAYQALAKSQ